MNEERPGLKPHSYRVLIGWAEALPYRSSPPQARSRFLGFARNDNVRV